MSPATVIMISSLLEDSSDGFVAIPIQLIEEITNKVFNLFTFEEISKGKIHVFTYRVLLENERKLL
jgi:hypothetical protein